MNISDIMKKVIENRMPTDISKIEVEHLIKEPTWIEKEITLLKARAINRDYRERQMRHSRPSSIGGYLSQLLDQHKEIDELQGWIVTMIVKFNNNVTLSSQLLLKKLQQDDGSELYHYRKSIFELIR